MRLVTLATGLGVAFLAAGSAEAETVSVKYIGLVDLRPYTCTNTVSSFVHRVCFDGRQRRAVLLLRDTYYMHCGIDQGTVDRLIHAPSVGRAYNATVRGRFDCRLQ